MDDGNLQMFLGLAPHLHICFKSKSLVLRALAKPFILLVPVAVSCAAAALSRTSRTIFHLLRKDLIS